MATTIPALNTKFSDVRFAFFNERYTETYTEIPGEPLPAAPSNLLAYAKGGGFVPNTAAFNGIGTNTEGDPLRLSQFSGFTVPSRTVVQTITSHTVDSYRSASGPSIYSTSQALSEIYVSTDGNIYGRGSTSWISSGTFAQGHILIDGQDYWADNAPPSNPGSDPGPVSVQAWLTGPGASDFSCRATILAGSTIPDGTKKRRQGDFGSWLTINQNRSWSIIVDSYIGGDPGFDSESMVLYFTLEIARNSDLNTILGSATMTLEAQAISTSEIAGPGFE